jgi:hypothetical protein
MISVSVCVTLVGASVSFATGKCHRNASWHAAHHIANAHEGQTVLLNFAGDGRLGKLLN